MKLFSATVKDASGSRRDVLCEADTESGAAGKLRAEGFLVLRIAAAEDPGRPPPSWHPSWLLPMTDFDLETGLRQIASMLKSGVTLIEALNATEEQSRSPRAARAWRGVKERVLSGTSFSGALEKDRRHFPEIIIQLARVGEHSGELDDALNRAAEHLESKRNLRSMMVNALVYPIIAVLMAVGVSVFLIVAVIPKIAAFLQAGGAVLPPVTQTLIDISDWFTANGITVTLSVVSVAAFWFLVGLTRTGREAEDAFLLKIPVSGKILRLTATSMFARSMHTMLSSGVGLVESLKIAEHLAANTRFKRRILSAHDAVIKGSSFAGGLADAREFMPMLRRMVAVGEMSGSLPDTLKETARFHEMMLSVLIKRLNVIIEPVIICITGAIVGFVYIAFFTAVFSMANAN